jgi:uncharacterized membrane protein
MGTLSIARAARPLAALAAALLLAFYLRPAAAADPMNISVCNEYSSTIYLALGWHDQEGWHSRGWWSADPGHCTAVPITTTELYYHWVSAAETNCICPPSRINAPSKNARMLAVTSNAFNLNDADSAQGNAHLVWFNPTLFTFDGFNAATFAGVNKLTITQQGNDAQTVHLHQRVALLPLP